MLTHLRLTGYRNLADARLDIPPEGVALVGENAQGKTNLLEAIYYLEIFRSFRGTPDSRIIRFGEDVFRVEGRLARAGSERVVAAAYQRRGRTKKVVVDGVEPDRLGDAIGEVAAILFTPEDVRIVSDGPEERRRFLDILLSLNVPGYLEDLQRFRQALSQRNAVLREGGGEAAIVAWNAPLARFGGRVASVRAAWIGRRAEEFRTVFEEISGGEVAAIRYRPGSGSEDARGAEDTRGTEDTHRIEAAPPHDSTDDGEDGEEFEGDASAWEARLLEGLARGLESDRRRGTTQTGPHRDEVRMQLIQGDRGRDIRHFGSGGQRRTAALALRILEAGTVAERRGHAPLLLLDDVFAELDAPRSRAVVSLLDRTGAGQVILTAPKEADLRFRSDRLARWTVKSGTIRTAAGEAA